MIQLKIEKKCENCNEFKAKQYNVEIYADNVAAVSEKNISCKYKDICDRIERMFKEQKEGEVQG